MYKLKKLFPQALKNFYHLAQAILANVIFGFPSRRLKVIGVTGTDGKTTTAQMIAKILEDAGKKVAMASTINFRINGVEEKNLSHFTTSSAFSLQRFLARAAKAQCEYLVLETSSHALDQFRVWGISFQTAVITNITREHLDYHKTIEKNAF
jgi:UDP-N-acetylmuramoyl-L-alanyl-D-glutamate--2,6-diaminopimelate ligase